MKPHKGVVLTAQFNRNGKVLVSGSQDGTIVLSHIEKNTQILQLSDTDEMNPPAVNCLRFSNDSYMVAGGFNNGKVKIWNLKEKQIVFQDY